MKKSILIVENSNHYHVLDYLAHFYKKKNYDVTLALTWTMDKGNLNKRIYLLFINL